MSETHIVKAYDEELAKLSGLIVEMGGMAESELAEAIRAVISRDNRLAAKVIEDDRQLDDLEREIEHFVMRLLALRQPMADDLRKIVSALKISGDIERIGDYAKNVAKRAMALNQVPQIKPIATIPRMGALAQQMIKDTLDAFMKGDAQKAVEICDADEEVDDLYNSLFRELLTYMMEDPRSISTCTHLLFIAKNIERIGDHATNVAESIYFMVRGEPMLEERSKGDNTSFAVVTPPERNEGE